MTSNPGGTSDGVVFHLDEGDPAKHAAVLRNINNLLDALGPDTPVELVAHGPGLPAVLADSPHADALQAVLGRGVRVDACGNTMREKDVAPERLAPGVTVVPAGVAQLVLRQREGWSYVRP